MPSRKRRTWEIIIGFMVLIIFTLIYISVLNGYDQEIQASSRIYSQKEGINPNHVAIDVKIVHIDPIEGVVQARLSFTPKGNLLADDLVSANKTLWLEVNADRGKAEYEFKRGDAMNPVVVTYALYGGNANYYPFDHHNTLMHFDLSTPIITKTMPTPEQIAGGKAPLPQYEQIPFTIDFNGSFGGYSIKVTELDEDRIGYADLSMTVGRSPTVIIFACFVMVLKWLLAMTAVFMMLSVTVRGRKAEITMFTWMAALLFALPPLRNSMPNIPPIGSLPDFVAFFWAEGLVAISMICIAFTWLKRPPHKNKDKYELKDPEQEQEKQTSV
jgi:hypothetical protein